MTEVERCESCRALIRWYSTIHGKHIMVDADPSGSSEGLTRSGYGNLAIVGGVAHVIRREQVYDGDLFVAHYARCKHARRLTGGGLKKARDRTIAKVKGEADGS